MKVELFPFQKRALADLRMKTGEAIGGYQRTHSNQVVSFTAPTGAGKTIIMASLIENIPESVKFILFCNQLSKQNWLSIALIAVFFQFPH